MLYCELVRVERLWRMQYDQVIRKSPDQSEEQIDGDRSLDSVQRDRPFLQHLQKHETGQERKESHGRDRAHRCEAGPRHDVLDPMDNKRDQCRARHEPSRHPILCDKQHARDEKNRKPGAGEQHAFLIRQRS